MKAKVINLTASYIAVFAAGYFGVTNKSTRPVEDKVEQYANDKAKEAILKAAKYGYEYHQTDSLSRKDFESHCEKKVRQKFGLEPKLK